MKIIKKNFVGEVTWQYDGSILQRNENSVTIEAFFNRDDMPFMNIVLKRNDRFVETFYSDKWYNIFAIYDRDDAKFKGWYCNITKPAIIQMDLITYEDLALDLWVDAAGAQTILDEEELLDLKLSDELNQKIYQAMEELKLEIKNKKLP